MGCKKCGSILIFDPEKLLICPKCEAIGIVLSKENTNNALRKELNRKIIYF